jgi:hypothetical protein
MDSRLKTSVDGFSQYFEERKKRLQELTTGFIQIGVRIHPLEHGGLIVILVEDSGSGFDFNARHNSTQSTQLCFGRGIILIESLCESLYFSPPGNKAEAIFRWQKG